MKTIQIDAEEVMQSSNPLAYMAGLFGQEADSMESLRMKLSSSTENLIVEVLNWPADEKGWEPLADMLEGVQQHSSYFYLIWGTARDFVNVHATGDQPVLINPPRDGFAIHTRS